MNTALESSLSRLGEPRRTVLLLGTIPQGATHWGGGMATAHHTVTKILSTLQPRRQPASPPPPLAHRVRSGWDPAHLLPLAHPRRQRRQGPLWTLEV